MKQNSLQKIVIATHNTGKLREFQTLMAPFGIEAISAGVLNLPEPEEAGVTFAQNAIIKAQAAANASGLPALADDSGLCVEALNNAPGVFSARWAGDDKNFTRAIERIENELGDKPRNAHFMCMLCLAMPEGDYELFEGRIDGTISSSARGLDGFGYDPIFEPIGYTQTFGEMSKEQKNKISHRAIAFVKFAEFMKNKIYYSE